MTKLADIQRRVGVSADGKWCSQTASAVAKALGMEATAHVMADPGAFFSALRNLTGPLNQVQMDTVNNLLARTVHWPASWLAYPGSMGGIYDGATDYAINAGARSVEIEGPTVRNSTAGVQCVSNEGKMLRAHSGNVANFEIAFVATNIGLADDNYDRDETGMISILDCYGNCNRFELDEGDDGSTVTPI